MEQDKVLPMRITFWCTILALLLRYPSASQLISSDVMMHSKSTCCFVNKPLDSPRCVTENEIKDPSPIGNNTISRNRYGDIYKQQFAEKHLIHFSAGCCFIVLSPVGAQALYLMIKSLVGLAFAISS